MSANKNIGRARILQQLKNMQKDKVDYLHAQPLQSDLYTWHFTFRGPESTDFHQGLYHGQILLPFQYPFKPPDIIFANKNGRFEVNTKICLTITQYHTQQWNSAWTIRTMLQAVISLFNERVMGHGYLESSPEARRYFAKVSHEYACEKCGKICEIIKPRTERNGKIEKEKKEAMEEKVQKEESKYEYHQIQGERKNSIKISQDRQQQKQKQPKFPQKIQQPQSSQLPSKIPKKLPNFPPKNEQIPSFSSQQPKQNPQIPIPSTTNQIQKQKPQKVKKNKKKSPQQFFYQSLMLQDLQYMIVIGSKKLIME